MTAISPIRIHKPDSCHGWGIEFNYERPFWDANATNFVVAVRQAMQDKKVQLSGSTKAGVIPKFMVAIMVTSILRSGTHVRKKRQSVWQL